MDKLTQFESKNRLREKIIQLESQMLARTDIQVKIEPKHYFANGLYLREIYIPKGTCLTGKIHKTEHICILSLGEVSVCTDSGMKRIKASTVVHSEPGTKRVLYAHEDSVWINCHFNPTNESDLEKIDEIFVTDTFEKFMELEEQKKITGGN